MNAGQSHFNAGGLWNRPVKERGIVGGSRWHSGTIRVQGTKEATHRGSMKVDHGIPALANQTALLTFLAPRRTFPFTLTDFQPEEPMQESPLAEGNDDGIPLL